MTDNQLARDILWHCSLLASSEHASLIEVENDRRLGGLAVLPLGGEPYLGDCDALCDGDWKPRSSSIEVILPMQVRTIELRSDHVGDWEVNGESASHLNGCSDIDLGQTPATNTVPLRRLDLEVGDTTSIVAAWVDPPNFIWLAVKGTTPGWRPDRWRYRSDDYDFELVTDAASGLVLVYVDDFWRAAARS